MRRPSWARLGDVERVARVEPSGIGPAALPAGAWAARHLSRYTHRTAIGNERIQAITPAGEVVFSVRADDHGGKRLMTLPGDEFIRRFLQRVLPSGIKRIRHYGALANGCKKTQLAQARQALA